MDPARLILALIIVAAAAGPVMRLITRAGESEVTATSWRRPVGIVLGVVLLLPLLALSLWAIHPVLPGMFQYQGGEPYFIGSGGQGIGPGRVGCTSLSVIAQEGKTPLVPVGHISWVTPLTRERGWLWSVPIGFEVFQDAHPPSHPPYPKWLWVKTDDDCYVEAHGYLR